MFADTSFDFVLKSPPASYLILKKVKADKGSGEPNKKKVGTLSMADLEEIAKIKMADLSANDIQNACRIIAGTARSMGVNTPEL